MIKELGVEIKLDTKIESLNKVFKQGYDAIFVAIGAHHPARIGIEGENLPGAIDGESGKNRRGDVNLH